MTFSYIFAGITLPKMDQVVDHMSFDVVIVKFVLFKKTKTNKQMIFSWKVRLTK